METLLPDAAQIRFEERILNARLYQSARPQLLTFLGRLQGAADVAELDTLALDLYVDFAARQTARDEIISRHRGAAKTRIRGLTGAGELGGALRQEQQFLHRIHDTNEILKATQHALRVIADGIVWRALDYDRAAVCILSRGERVGRLAQGRGLEAEIETRDRLAAERGSLVLLNDMTNCLRVGDITEFVTDGGRTVPDPYEVKAGRHVGAASAQVERIDVSRELLRSGVHPTAADGRPLRIERLPSPYRTHLPELRPLLAEARELGHAWTTLDDDFLVSIVDYRHWGGRTDELLARIGTARDAVAWVGESPTLDWTSSIGRIRDRRYTVSATAPVSIFPFPAEEVVDLLLGFVDVAVKAGSRSGSRNDR